MYAHVHPSCVWHVHCVYTQVPLEKLLEAQTRADAARARATAQRTLGAALRIRCSQLQDTCDKLRARLEAHEPVANEEGGEPNEAGSAA